jgi:MFS family permease
MGELRQNLSNSMKDGAAASLMVGMGETYIPAFVLAVGLAETSAGLIVTIPILAGAILQLVAPAAVTALGSHKRWVVGCAIAQSSVFLALMIAALTGSLGTIAAFSIAAIYWGCGMAGGSAWNTWISTLVPARLRIRFFSRRSRWLQAFTLTGFLVAGITLKLAQGNGTVVESARHDLILHAFAALFGAAFVARLVSAWYLSRQTEPVPVPHNQRQVPVSQLLLRLRRSPDGKLILYLVMAQAATQVAAPYFTPFMLRQMQLDYGTYAALVAAAFAARIFSLPFLGRFAERSGANKLLLTCGVAMAPMAVMWVFAYQNLPALFALQVMSGIVWGGFELASSLLIFERISPAERTSVLTTYNLSNASALVAGSLLGGAVFEALGSNFEGYLVIFALSSLLRAMTVTLLLPAAGSGGKSSLEQALAPVHRRKRHPHHAHPEHRDAS